MAITLEQMKLTSPNALDKSVIQEFQANSFLLNHMPFETCSIPSGTNTTFVYEYFRTVTPSATAFRDFGEEYTPSSAELNNFTVALKPFGGTFNIDRKFINAGFIDRCEYEISEKIISATATFNNCVINGDSAVDAKTFDGLDKALTGSNTEFIPPDAIDLSTDAAVSANGKSLINWLNRLRKNLNGTPTCILGNTEAILKIAECATDRALYQTNYDSFGTLIESYARIPLIDLGNMPGTGKPIISTDSGTGETSLYAVVCNEKGFHGVMSPDGLVETVVPKKELTASSNVTGRVEMLAAVALKATRAAGVLRKIKVA